MRSTLPPLTTLPSPFFHNLVNRTCSPLNRAPNMVFDEPPLLSSRLIDPKLPMPSPTPQIPRSPRICLACVSFSLALTRFVHLEYLRFPKSMMKQLRRHTPALPVLIPTCTQQRNIVCRTTACRLLREGRQDECGRSAVHRVGEGAEGPVASVKYTSF